VSNSVRTRDVELECEQQAQVACPVLGRNLGKNENTFKPLRMCHVKFLY
jgi:hypothetical protein